MGKGGVAAGGVSAAQLEVKVAAQLGAAVAAGAAHRSAARFVVFWRLELHKLLWQRCRSCGA